MPKYLSLGQIRESIQRLGSFHVFFGTTFLVLKRNEAPVGHTMHLSLDAENREHLRRYFRLHPKSDYFFTPFKTKKNEGNWRSPNYASTSLQAINTQGFAGALVHREKEKNWGWSADYLSFLAKKLPKGQRLPLFNFAVWFEREVQWEESATRADVVAMFIRHFQIDDSALSKLFDTTPSSMLSEEEAFQQDPATWNRIIEGFGTPDDVPPEGSAILHLLEFSGLGPVRRLHFEPAPRLNVITGDNGLGKTFLLDVVWWALTQVWAEHMIVPLEPVATSPLIKFSVANTPDQGPVTAEFKQKSQRWEVPRLSAISGLAVYVRVDGSFAVWDPANPTLSGKGEFKSFTREGVWKGDKEIEGLLRDWVRWQTRAAEFPAFLTFQKVLQRTMPPDLGELAIGKPVRLPEWPMEIPTLVHPYGTVPIVFESAGIRRIMTLAYLIVWAWEEHKIQAKLAGRKEERQMVILLDEAEAHLHPRWQRVLLPALLGIAQDLHEELSIQYFIASHSPLVLASAEPVWNSDKDGLFHLHMNAAGKVHFDRMPFELRGTADSWLQSPSFDGLHPGSEPAEQALREAKSLLEKPSVKATEVQAASDKLAEHIAADDPFWLRWVLFAGQHGIEL
jgi:AAA ATPase domain/AAA domain